MRNGVRLYAYAVDSELFALYKGRACPTEGVKNNIALAYVELVEVVSDKVRRE